MFQKEVIELSRTGKWTMYMLLFLIIISVYNDLSQVEQSSSPINKSHLTDEKTLFVITRTIHRGDTLLSIMEEIHGNNNTNWQIDQVIHDFKLINDGQDPYQLIEQQTYYFPLYMR